MEDFVEKAFPRHLKHGRPLPAGTIKLAVPAGRSSHPYLRKIFFQPPEESGSTVTEAEYEKVEHKWEIDRDTRAIQIVNKMRVVVLLTSSDIKQVAKNSNAAAVVFAVGGDDGKAKPVATGGAIQQDRSRMSGGRVMYVLSHFGKQKSQEDEYTLQNLLINFLLESSQRRLLWGKGNEIRGRRW